MKRYFIAFAMVFVIIFVFSSASGANGIGIGIGIGINSFLSFETFSDSLTLWKRAQKMSEPGYSLRPKKVERGVASWYGPGFHGRKRADGKRYNMNTILVAHRSLPLGTKVRVTNLENRKVIIAKVRDRGPYIFDRCLDLSRGAARELGAIKPGLIPVKIEVLDI